MSSSPERTWPDPEGFCVAVSARGPFATGPGATVAAPGPRALIGTGAPALYAFARRPRAA